MSAATKISPDFRLRLQQEFMVRCRKNPKYSIRSFARFLETDFSTLAKIMNGKRPLGQKVIQQYGEKLGLSPAMLAPYLGINRRRLLSLTNDF